MGRAILAGEKPTIEVKEEKAYINGVLGKPFHNKFKKFVAQNPTIKTVVFENVPGSANDEWNVKTCVLLHKSGMNTELKPYSEIASGGVDLFISGHKRTIAESAKIGVHSWQDSMGTQAKDLAKDHKDHEMFIVYNNEMLGSDDFYWYTIYAAPAEDIYYMTPNEINDVGNLQADL